MLRIDPSPPAGARRATAAGRTKGPRLRRGAYVGQRAFSNTADTVHHFEWDGRRWRYRGRWRLGERGA